MDTSIIKGSSGKISTMRICTLLTVISVLGIFIAHNVVAMISGGGFVSVGASEAILLGAALGMKSVQRFAEGKTIEEDKKE